MSSFSDSSAFVDAAACGDLDGVKTYLGDPDFPAEHINKVDKDGRSAFHYASLNDDKPLLTLLLADPRVEVTLRSPNGDTALHMASLYAALEAMRLLFKDGRIPLDSKNKYGETPLHLCAGSGDKGAASAAKMLLDAGASLTVTDKWKRGPKDVSQDNAENPLVKVFKEYLDANPEVAAQVEAVTAGYVEEASKPVYTDSANQKAKSAIFGMIGGVQLKKTETKVKSMFNKSEGTVTAGAKEMAKTGDGRRALSKLIDFPGDKVKIAEYLDQPEKIDPNGKDAYGLTALHKFASWNKTEYIDLIVPKLSSSDLMTPDREGKTALHWAVEMASVAAVKSLVAAGADVEALDGKGRSVKVILDNVESSGIIDRLKAALEK